MMVFIMPVMMFAVFMMALLCIMLMTVHMGGFVVSVIIIIISLFPLGCIAVVQDIADTGAAVHHLQFRVGLFQRSSQEFLHAQAIDDENLG